MITEITSTEHFKQIINQDAVCVVDYHAEWAGPAKQLLATLDQLSKVYRKVNFYTVDVDEHAQLTQMAGARIFPTVIIYRSGAKLNAMSGASPEGLSTLIQTAVCA
ncbi:hypothetical protein M408DRAFT_236993 [Serendipita vermifera MAFF 305830]|uniref:Thioredoxin domain-containing protein n=1 Tax=Serendipita vermifera MAFF 305830 TaxID=933852 RepID=A0A0C3BHX5_SERVB|nr:hypothetical protein M408DRAFT_236993 [Serendipita vermifera MAFF 305830]